ncbi:enoyl-CoA hydratase [Pseudomonas aeruginosa]|uniref:enoyl-CoA hydratase/isomerase family protein n=1 Tax=Pseudomonas aeruginosa group TaxID=136841 RepID=UPI0005BC0401|nr:MULTISPECIES: enoyl-CoA hydratase/isomerase family protein [Pseudomonas aeruginosa group]KRU85374.1 enoyl-CoA hydratase [Pseudomonas aeruginosa]KSP92500.1 enoyl-CoA hydratase [Pseudomonas aeruginosa]MBG7007762.1 enoyl-CoA hydratase/isomerase family protein [Pseudomonas aeruginosa]MBG7027185.1 enoyl-CoA hydratase/isomerase family protein [Pseudomonas aeruginosa]MBG7372723.1 enoyl-CoA hydratase/isomerase family protein [Pseudomonas aeruginosa]
MSESVTFEVKGQVGWITLSRPKAMNALNPEMLQAMVECLKAWEGDADVRVVALTATGPAFCAGADLKVSGTPEPGEMDLLDNIVTFFDRLRVFPKPVIAAVNGLALAGGLETVLCCDFVIAAESARFGDAHSNFGVFPGGGGAAILPRKIPENVAKYLLFTGDSLPAQDMKTYGLVSEVVPDGQLLARVQAIGDKLADKSPLVLRRMKRVADEAADKSRADALRHELLELRNHQRSYDIAEGLRAFAEKRKPAFKGY